MMLLQLPLPWLLSPADCCRGRCCHGRCGRGRCGRGRCGPGRCCRGPLLPWMLLPWPLLPWLLSPNDCCRGPLLPWPLLPWPLLPWPLLPASAAVAGCWWASLPGVSYNQSQLPVRVQYIPPYHTNIHTNRPSLFIQGWDLGSEIWDLDSHVFLSEPHTGNLDSSVVHYQYTSSSIHRCSL